MNVLEETELIMMMHLLQLQEVMIYSHTSIKKVMRAMESIFKSIGIPFYQKIIRVIFYK